MIKESYSAYIVGKVDTIALLNEEASFTLADIHNISDVQLKFKSQTGREDTSPKIIKLGPAEYNIRWTPRELGIYTISAFYLDQQIRDTPFVVKVFDPKLVKISNLTEGLVGKPSTFLVDASEAGEGSLEIGITSNGHFIPNQVRFLK
jgi:hypothetical protein